MARLELEARLDNLLSTAQEETKDIDLFAPIIVADREECPICMIPLPLLGNDVSFMYCCGKQICNGCAYKQMKNDFEKGKRVRKCAFCCQPKPRNNIKALRKLMKKKNPTAYMQMVCLYRDGDEGLMQSYTRSLEMSIEAAELGHASAYGSIGGSHEEEIAWNKMLQRH